MYKIIGGDGKEYGPVSAEEVSRWIEQRRAGPNTKVQPEGSTEWRLLSELPEFSGALASAPAAPEGSGAPAPSAQGRAGYAVDIGRLFSRGWALITRFPAVTLGATAIVLVLSIGIEFIPVVGTVAGFLLHGPLWGGLCYPFLKLIRGQDADIADLFIGFRAPFIQLMVCGLLVQLLGAVGLLLCIIPGVYLFVVWAFALPLVLDKGMEFWPAMETSRKTVQEQFWPFLGLAVVSVLIILAGAVAFGVGLFLAAPLVTAIYMHAYEDLFGSRTQGEITR